MVKSFFLFHKTRVFAKVDYDIKDTLVKPILQMGEMHLY